jgi:hypothetical protein
LIRCGAAQAFAVMEQTPNLLYLLLSKRIGNAIKMCDPMAGNPACRRTRRSAPRSADQEEYDRDRMKLKEAGIVSAPLHLRQHRADAWPDHPR